MSEIMKIIDKREKQKKIQEKKKGETVAIAKG